MNQASIIIVEDDKDDCELLTTALIEIGVKNQFKCFDTPLKALQYLRTTTDPTFLIISDVNLPRMNGIDFKRSINNDKVLNEKRIPFVFLSTLAPQSLVREAFSVCAQGYFEKPASLNAYTDVAKAIIEYWRRSKIPQGVN